MRKTWRAGSVDALPLAVLVVAVSIKASVLAGALAGGRTRAAIVLLVADGVMLAILPLLFVPWRMRAVAALVLDVIVSTVVLADIVHIRFFGNAIALTEISYAHQLVDVLPSVLRLLHPSDVLYYADCFVGGAACLWFMRRARRIPPTRLRARLLAAGIVLGLGIPLLPGLLRVVARDADVYANFMQHIHPEPDEGAIGEPQEARVLAFLRDRRQRDAQRSRLFGAASGANVILLSAESLNRFPIGLEVNGQPVTPRLTAFARESLDFPDSFDQTWSGGTSDAEFMALHSLHPVRSGSVAFRYPRTVYRGLPAILTEQGYVTASLCAAKGTFWNMATTHRRFGFQRSYFEEHFHGEQVNGWIADDAFFQQAVPLLAGLGHPFFAFLLSSSNHHPFAVPPRHRTLSLGPLEGSELGDYLHSVHYFDRAFGVLIDRLRATSLLDTSIVVLYGDHRGYRGDERQLARLFHVDAAAERDMWLLTRRVPLMIRLPQGQHRGSVDVVGGILDIAPTILSLLGVDGETRFMLGSDLTAQRQGAVVLRDGGFINTRREMMIRSAGTSCFDAGGRPLPCSSLQAAHDQSLDQLQTSDFIIQGNLIPSLAAKWPHAPVAATR